MPMTRLARRGQVSPAIVNETIVIVRCALRAVTSQLDGFVASLLAMTVQGLTGVSVSVR